MVMSKQREIVVELGEEITEDVQIRRGAGIVVSARLSREEAEQLQILAQLSGKSISEIARDALRMSLRNAMMLISPQGFSGTVTDFAALYASVPFGTSTSAPLISETHRKVEIAEAVA
jgi:hypothetical protein